MTAADLLAAVRHHQEGRLDPAESLYRALLARDPANSDALHLLGVIAYQRKEYSTAIGLIRRALDLRNVADYHSNLASALREMGSRDEAVAHCLTAIALKPAYPQAHYNLGNALHDMDRLDEAVVAFRAAIAFNPAYPQAFGNLGFVLKKLERSDEAVAAFRAALALKPDYPKVRFNHAMTLLLRGDFEAGWPEYEWRWRDESFPSLRRDFPQPRWSGDFLEGKTILLHGEQGFGDILQFVRYVPLVAQRGGTVLLEVPPALRRLLGALPGASQVLALGEPLPSFDVHCPLLSLPRAFKTTLDTIPAGMSSFTAERETSARWAERFAGVSALKVGLVWAGSRHHQNDRSRSLPFSSLAPLWRIPGVRWFSLQVGERAADLKEAPPGQIEDLAPALSEFAETAEAVRHLDLVVTVDTAVAHLAGGLGVPTWIMLPFAPDWRWLENREDSPWYPTVRLFRQPARGDWESVMARVADALAGSVSRGEEEPPCGAGMDGAALSAKGLAARAAGHLDEALQWQSWALRAAPGNWAVRLNTAVALQDAGLLTEAIAHFEAVARTTGAPVARVNLAMARLRAGDLAQGFSEFLARWTVEAWPQKPYTMPIPHRLDRSAALQPLVVLPDQGYGDTLMALPFIRWLLRRNPHMSVVVRPPLLALARVALGDLTERVADTVSGGFAGWLTGFDVPGVFPECLSDYETERREIGRRLRAHHEGPENPFHGDGRRVAVVWRGNPAHILDRWRSLPATTMGRMLSDLETGTEIVSLQPDATEAELDGLAGMSGKQHSVRAFRSDDFLSSACLLRTCDTMLGVDTAAVHLAGLMGVRTAVLVNAFGDWRWGDRRDRCFWYPQARVLRQERLSSWDSVLGLAQAWLSLPIGEAGEKIQKC
ncbi:tetratricopeptide repeat-containing glycosyltransferase family protein [Azospirillum sp.]|uniref:tetratricopeptide repeat-containing glycosyltransferase family protein n=1 Tax=Azospirillum sp. TaxID=34012 RepID=UPI002D29D361|nr:tetratricopeptide repeat-containing glycosyltransferase family protein [Azospirillum sp.]HYD69447.1 tetratricopeptide repeat-containing glycosyltransferase family protein [Azospirillum sp.]